MKQLFAVLFLFGIVSVAGAARQEPTPEDARQMYKRSMELYTAGRFNDAFALAGRALSISRRLLGEEHSDVALMLNGVALICVGRGDFSTAEPLYERALAIYTKLSETARPESNQRAAAGNVATTNNNLGELYRLKGEYDRAEPYFRRALNIAERVNGAESEPVATTLNNLGNLYRTRGDYAAAEPLFRRAAVIYEKVEGAGHPDVALALNNLAAIYYDRGDFNRAEPLYLRALAIREKALGADHPDVANTLSNLAELYSAKGDLARAQQLETRALGIYVKASGRDHPDVAVSLNNLASLYLLAGDFAHAEPLYERALEINSKALGPEHPEVSRTLNNLAAVACARGDNKRAETLYLRALAIREKSYGREHPLVATTLNNLGELYRAGGDIDRAVKMTAAGLEIRERNFELVLASGSEDQKQLYINKLSGETHAAVSLHVRSAPSDPQAARLALTTILRRKGRALDAMTDQVAALRRRAGPEEARLLDQLAAARSQLAKVQLSSNARVTSADRQSEIARLSASIANLEDLVSRRSSRFRSDRQPITLEAVRQAIPSDSALVEIFAFKPFNSRAYKASERFSPAQYVAYVSKPDSPSPRFVELGPADAIDREIARLRAALHDPKRADVKELARSFDDKIMRPIRSLLGPTRKILLSPDGALNLIPFAALVDEQGHYLVENWTITYLTSGRDLLRLQVPRESVSSPVVLGDPLYDLGPTANAANSANDRNAPQSTGKRSVDFSALRYQPLPGTAQEARALGGLLPGAQILLQRQATESAIKAARAPRVLHIATHGFFLPDQQVDEGVAEARALLHPNEKGPEPTTENALLRSGIILAGVNQRQSGPGEDGVLTAYEASGLDLWGTQLVVLSACETGLGDVHNGAGVYGLRRALVLAGSETQVISLWSVSDLATRDLMTGFYRRLQTGESRADALRNTQLVMLRGNPVQSPATGGNGTVVKGGAGPDFSHPFYWAPFIESGAWSSMKPSR